jgi:hypothetical protein
MEEDNLHVTEDIIQSLVRGIVGELFVPDNRHRQDQKFGATEACRELELIIGNVDAEKQCKWLLLLLLLYNIRYSQLGFSGSNYKYEILYL